MSTHENKPTQVLRQVVAKGDRLLESSYAHLITLKGKHSHGSLVLRLTPFFFFVWLALTIIHGQYTHHPFAEPLKFITHGHIIRDYSSGDNCSLQILKVAVYYRAVGTAAATVALGARLHFSTQCFSLMYTIL